MEFLRVVTVSLWLLAAFCSVLLHPLGPSLTYLFPQPVPRILVQPTFSDARATRTEEVSHQVGAVPLQRWP